MLPQLKDFRLGSMLMSPAKPKSNWDESFLVYEIKRTKQERFINLLFSRIGQFLSYLIFLFSQTCSAFLALLYFKLSKLLRFYCFALFL